MKYRGFVGSLAPYVLIAFLSLFKPSADGCVPYKHNPNSATKRDVRLIIDDWIRNHNNFSDYERNGYMFRVHRKLADMNKDGYIDKVELVEKKDKKSGAETTYVKFIDGKTSCSKIVYNEWGNGINVLDTNDDGIRDIQIVSRSEYYPDLVLTFIPGAIGNGIYYACGTEAKHLSNIKLRHYKKNYPENSKTKVNLE